VKQRQSEKRNIRLNYDSRNVVIQDRKSKAHKRGAVVDDSVEIYVAAMEYVVRS
jgi:hypothetical protein